MRQQTIVRLGIIACLALVGAGCSAEEVTWGVGSWDESMGSQRARVSVTAKADAVRAHIPWRRLDANPQKRGIAVVESATGKAIQNVSIVYVDHEFGDIVFQADSPGDYDIYYMLYTPVARTPDQKWESSYSPGKMRGVDRSTMPEARVTEIQARTQFDRFDPMEVIATRQEVEDLLVRNPLKSYLLFPEDRRYPIRMADYLPERWVKSGPSMEFHGEGARGEYYTFQVGVYAARAAIDSGKEYGDIRVGFGDLRSEAGDVIPATFFGCPSLVGSDWLGRPMARGFKVGIGKVRPLWFGVQIPEDIRPGDYVGTVPIKVFGAPEVVMKLTLTVTDKVLKDAGDSEPWRMSRLWWLDSRIGIDDETVAPFTPIKVDGARLRMLEREIRFGKSGLPESIKSSGREILARPMDMLIEGAAGVSKLVGTSNPKTVKESAGRVVREYSGSCDTFAMKCLAVTDLDGHCDFTVALKAKKDATVKDIRLEIPMKREVAVYLMGLGRKGGYRPREWHWKWDINRANNTAWVGDADAGLWLKLKGQEDTPPGDDLKAYGIPQSWGNANRGGCDVIDEADCALVRAYSGARVFKEGDEVTFRFAVLVTPMRPIDSSHWSRRYDEAYRAVDDIKETGANIVSVPCGNEMNPYTNYPFLATDKLLDYVQDAHRVGARVNLSYNTGELTNHCAELWALRSLGDEVISDGPAGGSPWLQEHLISNYKPGVVRKLSDTDTDAAIVNAGLSRWDNYYVEGLAWLTENTRIDGLYLDGVGFDREVMKRVRKVMDATALHVPSALGSQPVLPKEDESGSYSPPAGEGMGPALPLARGEGGGGLIDLHSGTDPNDLGPRISPACRYMDMLPYVNSFRFDGMRPDAERDYWLVEVSGIPFGIVGDVPLGVANPWRAMLYGMASRAGSSDDPRPIWQLWDDFGIKDATMTGYWSSTCPVKTNNKDVLATVYAKKGKALMAIASWAKEPARVKLTIDWKALGLDIRKADLTAPAIPGIQDAKDFQWSGDIPVAPGKGWLLVLSEE